MSRNSDARQSSCDLANECCTAVLRTPCVVYPRVASRSLLFVSAVAPGVGLGQLYEYALYVLYVDVSR